MLLSFRTTYSYYHTQLNDVLHSAEVVVSYILTTHSSAQLSISLSSIGSTYKAVVISSFCKLLAIPVYIWAGGWFSLLPEVLQVVTRFQVFKGN